MSPYLILLVSILTLSTAQLCIKKGLFNIGEINFSMTALFNLFIRIFQSGWLLGGVFLFGVSFLFYLFVLSKLQLSVAYPVMVSVVIVLVTFFSWLLFKEQLLYLQLLGIALIIGGIFLLAAKI